MEWNFEIIGHYFHHNRGDFIFARFIEGQADFQLKEGSVLGGIPIYHYVEIPRTLDENGNPRFDIFVFRPLSLEFLPAGFFSEGQHVKLVSPD
ncbi:hypothetical protein D0C36_08165 [Mucilaginibacter conchicola]|uniref:Uncharacterized protein n=1 Tax=Mucilaginibacter conchicola TaxID=2303333 RepID=A0A372P035_9SPHI|nr:hypothetical protein [Mucilaginibacter conchicola]RFZ95484.1 hypothetical protein D0C36_08165 [Mucilaginibacter conchicola]